MLLEACGVNLVDSRRGETFEGWLAKYLAEYIDSVIYPSFLEYEKRLDRQQRVEIEVAMRSQQSVAHVCCSGCVAVRRGLAADMKRF